MQVIAKHPLFQEVRGRAIPLWQLKKMLGGKPAESKLSRVLNGVDEMPLELKNAIERVIKELEQQQQAKG